MAKKMIIKGVGNFLVKRWSADYNGEEIITLGSLQDLKITMNTEIDDIFGGDGLFAIDTLVKSKSIEVVATDAKFDLNAVKLIMGDTPAITTEDKYLWVLNEAAKVGSTTKAIKRIAITNGCTLNGDIIVTIGGAPYKVTVAAGDNEIAVATKIKNSDNIRADFITASLDDVVTFTAKLTTIIAGTVVITDEDVLVPTAVTGIGTNVQDGTGTTKTVTLAYAGSLATSPSITVRNKDTNKPIITFTNANGILTFQSGVSDGDSLLINYKRAENTLTSDDFYAILKDGVPFNVHVIHNGVYIQKDNSKAGIETELYQCRAKGALTIDAARATASTTNITLTVLDPEGDDGRLGTIKRFTM